MPESTVDKLTPTDRTNFWDRVDKSATCWIWTGHTNRDGYGLFSVLRQSTRKQLRAHRIAYALERSDIPSSLHLHHKCRCRLCVNPEHLEPIRPSDHAQKHHKKRTHCFRGHEFTPQNTIHRANHQRQCRACWQVHAKEHEKRRAERRAKVHQTRLYCKRGHFVAGDNVSVALGRWRRCKRCHREAQTDYREQNPESVRETKRKTRKKHATETNERRRRKRFQEKLEIQAAGGFAPVGPFTRLYCGRGHFVVGETLAAGRHGGKGVKRDCRTCKNESAKRSYRTRA